MENPQSDLAVLRDKLRDTRRAFLNGDASQKAPMEALAQECADLYNAKAKEVAKKLGTRPRLVSANKILHTLRYR